MLTSWQNTATMKSSLRQPPFNARILYKGVATYHSEQGHGMTILNQKKQVIETQWHLEVSLRYGTHVPAWKVPGYRAWAWLQCPGHWWDPMHNIQLLKVEFSIHCVLLMAHMCTMWTHTMDLFEDNSDSQNYPNVLYFLIVYQITLEDKHIST